MLAFSLWGTFVGLRPPSLMGCQALPTVLFPDLGALPDLLRFPFPVSDLPLLPNTCCWGWALSGGSSIAVLHGVHCSGDLFCILCPPTSGRAGCAHTFSCPTLGAVLGLSECLQLPEHGADGHSVNVSFRQTQSPSKARVGVGNVSPCPHLK